MTISPVFFIQAKFGDLCHIYNPILINIPRLVSRLAFYAVILPCVTVLHDPDANVHIAAIFIFDMLLR